MTYNTSLESPEGDQNEIPSNASRLNEITKWFRMVVNKGSLEGADFEYESLYQTTVKVLSNDDRYAFAPMRGLFQDVRLFLLDYELFYGETSANLSEHSYDPSQKILVMTSSGIEDQSGRVMHRACALELSPEEEKFIRVFISQREINLKYSEVAKVLGEGKEKLIGIFEGLKTKFPEDYQSNGQSSANNFILPLPIAESPHSSVWVDITPAGSNGNLEEILRIVRKVNSDVVRQHLIQMLENGEVFLTNFAIRNLIRVDDSSVLSAVRLIEGQKGDVCLTPVLNGFILHQNGPLPNRIGKALKSKWHMELANHPDVRSRSIRQGDVTFSTYVPSSVLVIDEVFPKDNKGNLLIPIEISTERGAEFLWLRKDYAEDFLQIIQGFPLGLVGLGKNKLETIEIRVNSQLKKLGFKLRLIPELKNGAKVLQVRADIRKD